MIRLSVFILLALILSCSILEDTDILTDKDFEPYIFKSLEIRQETNSGNLTTKATLLYDSATDFLDPQTGTRLTRKVGFAMGNLGDLKMKLRSGMTGPSEFFVRYTDDGQPYNFILFEGTTTTGTIRELYRFRYDNKRRLNKIEVYTTPVSGTLPAIIDTLIYDASGILTSITRKRGDGTVVGTFTMGTYALIESSSCQFSFTYPSDKEYSYCPSGFYIYPGGEDCNFELIGAPAQTVVRIGDTRKAGANCCGDIYYFHPVLLLSGKIKGGQWLPVIYSVDWWVLGANNPNDKDEFVEINLSYGR
ncbi:hypothetical protein QQ054_21335 [Oscillatoria amoena NRMC-F 0135]|nr:hypothetical protein [Oscillatoria amoena NRMC-F 0135]